MLLSPRPRRHSEPVPSARRSPSCSGGGSAAALPPAPCGPATLLLLGALATLILMSAWQASMVGACTTIVLGSHATDDGSLMVTHNNDCEDCDVRIGIVPAMDYQKDAACPIYPCGFDFPRYVGSSRGPLYTRAQLALEGLQHKTGWVLPNDTLPLASIPCEVERTYSYIDGSYGMMNEHQLSIGESTCGARIAAYSPARGGEALMEASTLTRLAMQRCKTAICAVELMGALSERYGFAGSEDPVEEGEGLFEVAGEALTVVDPSEAWVFHILADSTGRSAIWAAQRVPDHHVAVVPNEFVLERINVSDRANFRASRNIVSQAVAAGLIDSKTAEAEGGQDNFHFSRTFSLDYAELASGANGGEGERRRWRIFSLLAPSLHLSPTSHTRLPFSVPVEHLVSLSEVQSLMRDHYAHTAYDASRGLAAGPWGNPLRYDRDAVRQPESAQGFFERSVSLHRTSYSFVAQAKGDRAREVAVAKAREHQKGAAADELAADVPAGEGVLWFAHHTPATSVYLPLFCRSSLLPASFSRGSLFDFQRGDSAWWAFAAVANSVGRMYKPMHAFVKRRQIHWEHNSRKQVALLQGRAAQLVAQGKQEQAQQMLSDFTVKHNEQIIRAWWQLLDELTFTFRDGVVVESSHPPLQQGHLFYPSWWLEAVGYFDQGPLVKPDYPTVPTPLHAAPAADPTTHAPAASTATTTSIGETKQRVAKKQPQHKETRGLDEDMDGEEQAQPSATATVLVQRAHRRSRHGDSHSGSEHVLTEKQHRLLQLHRNVASDEEDAVAAVGSDLDTEADGRTLNSTRSSSSRDEDDTKSDRSTADSKSQPQPQQKQEQEEKKDRSVWSFLRSRRFRWPLAAGLFTLCLLLVGCVCFQLGRWWSGSHRIDRSQYVPISESIAQGLEAGGEGFSRTGPRVVLSTR